VNATIKELYDRKVYPVEVAAKGDVIGSVAVFDYCTDWELLADAFLGRLR